MHRIFLLSPSAAAFISSALTIIIMLDQQANQRKRHDLVGRAAINLPGLRSSEFRQGPVRERVSLGGPAREFRPETCRRWPHRVGWELRRRGRRRNSRRYTAAGTRSAWASSWSSSSLSHPLRIADARRHGAHTNEKALKEGAQARSSPPVIMLQKSEAGGSSGSGRDSIMTDAYTVTDDDTMTDADATGKRAMDDATMADAGEMQQPITTAEDMLRTLNISNCIDWPKTRHRPFEDAMAPWMPWR
ncbi:hypothetical protein BC567DRAFT_253395 [Phyllosticta citribraziliensis]